MATLLFYASFSINNETKSIEDKALLIEDDTNSINNRAFSYYKETKSIEDGALLIEDDTNSINNRAFSYYKETKSIEDGALLIEDGINSINNRAFSYYNKIESIEDGAFLYYNKALLVYTIPLLFKNDTPLIESTVLYYTHLANQLFNGMVSAGAAAMFVATLCILISYHFIVSTCTEVTKKNQESILLFY